MQMSACTSLWKYVKLTVWSWYELMGFAVITKMAEIDFFFLMWTLILLFHWIERRQTPLLPSESELNGEVGQFYFPAMVQSV